MQTMIKKCPRIEYIDLAKAIGIFLVCLGHTVDPDTQLKTIIYAFHMPLFFILSGGGEAKERKNIILKLIKIYSEKRLGLSLFPM